MTTSATTHATRTAHWAAALAYVPLNTLGCLLRDAFLGWLATGGSASAAEEDPRALLKAMLKAGATIPTDLGACLGLLWDLNEALRVACRACDDPPFLMVYRDAVCAGFMRPARCLADVAAKRAYLKETANERGLGEWVWCEGAAREAIVMQLGRDVQRLRAKRAS